MPFIRLSDNYIDHPKFLALSAAAFRLWHEGMAFCRKHQTDGLIAQTEAEGFRYYKLALVRELTTPYKLGVNPLWNTVVGVGYEVHDYLFWNLSKDEGQDDRESATERMRRLRTRRKAERDGVCSPVTGGERSGGVTPPVTPFVPDMDMDRDPDLHLVERESERKPPDEVAARAKQAGAFCERFCELYTEHLHGAHYHLKPSLDWARVCDLLTTWDAARLEKLAVILLTTDDEWIAKTDRGIGVFVARASWCDSRLKAWEATHGAA